MPESRHPQRRGGARPAIPAEPLWLAEDTRAAIEWQEFHDSLCLCGSPREETFAPENEERYEATALKCFKCATRDRKAYSLQQDRSSDAPPPAGLYFAVTGPTDD